MSQPASQTIRLSITSQLEHTVLVAMAVRGLCALTPLPATETNRIELCVVEVVNNAIEHAYLQQKDNPIEVIVSLLPEKSITIDVIDYGKRMSTPLNTFETPQTLDPDNPSTWECSGRGLAIVQEVMDEVQYHSSNDKNCFSMLFHFS